MNRRSFLKGLGGMAVSKFLPAASLNVKVNGKTLILIELKGGNDGLNTVVPFKDPLYYKFRPKIAIPPDLVIPISAESGLHPSLEPLKQVWDQQDLAIVQGLGYAKPNRSHFSSIDIWESALHTEIDTGIGWISSLFDRDPHIFKGSQIHALILGDPNLGPLKNGKISTLVTRGNGKRFRKTFGKHRASSSLSGNKPLKHIFKVQEQNVYNSNLFSNSLKNCQDNFDSFPVTRFGRSFKLLTRSMIGGLRPGVAKLTLSGFDTHSGQLAKHKKLLKELAESIRTCRNIMKDRGLWNDVLIMTYSEFGRRVNENGSGGTDHGTAAPHFLIGGRVQGGLYGKQPSLKNLSKGDLEFTMDFRSLYQTVMKYWWGTQESVSQQDQWELINCFKT